MHDTMCDCCDFSMVCILCTCYVFQLLFMFSARLVARDVEGRFEQLFTRINNIQKKSREFDVCYTVQ